MNYKTYAEAKIANPDSEIVTTGKKWSGDASLVGIFEALILDEFSDGDEDGSHEINDESWVICNPADHCSSLKEFLGAGFRLVKGDIILDGVEGLFKISTNLTSFNEADAEDETRYIISSAAINGCSKIPDKEEQWSVYNNTMPLCELTDEQAAMLFNAWRGGLEVEYVHCESTLLKNCETTYEWSRPHSINWGEYIIYRIKSKSERELFIENSSRIMHSVEGDGLINDVTLGALYDNGMRYKDLTKPSEV